MRITVPCCATDVFVPNDLDYGDLLYPTQGFSFVENCPPGYYCQPGLFPIIITIPVTDVPPVRVITGGGGSVITLQCCTGQLSETIPAGSTPAQIRAIATDLQQEWAAQQALCLAQQQATAKPRILVLPSGCVGTNYDVGAVPLTGTGPYVFTQLGGNVPPGLTWVQDTGTTFEVSGQPTQAGNFAFDVVAGGFDIQVQVSILGLTNAPTPATINVPYSFQYTAAGGVAPYQFSIVEGILPKGLTMSSSGLVTGTPTVGGTSTFRVGITDSSP